MKFNFYKETLIAIGISIAIVFCMIYFAYIPALKEVKLLKKELKKTETRNKKINKLGNNDKYFDDLYKRMDLLIEESLSYMPKKVKLSSLLRELSILAKQNNISLESIRPIDARHNLDMITDVKIDIPKDSTRTLIEIVLSSAYDNLGYYIKSIENNPLTVMAIKKISIDGSKDKEKLNPNALKTNLTIEAYYKN